MLVGILFVMTAAGSQRFATTHWSLIRAAGGPSSRPARVALEELCRTYWFPVYAFIRRRGRAESESEDLTQSFFVHLLKSEFIESADQDRGRFRSYLLKSVSNFLNAELRDRQAQKRGGTTPILQIDFEGGEQLYQQESASSSTPEQLFERRWAMTLLSNTMTRLRAEYADRNHLQLFASLEAHINQDSSRVPYAELCDILNMSEDAIKQAARRLKLRYREIIRGEIANTLGSFDEIDDELRELMNALNS